MLLPCARPRARRPRSAMLQDRTTQGVPPVDACHGRSRTAHPQGTHTARSQPRTHPSGRRVKISPGMKQTTSVLTTTTLKYTIGDGITAGAGTRIVLRLLLLQKFDLQSFQTTVTSYPHFAVRSFILFTTSPPLALGNFRACCNP
jgi:hypothetical protein